MTQVLKKSNNLQILISTKGKKDFTFLDSMFRNCDLKNHSILIVDQSESPKDISSLSKKFDIKSTQVFFIGSDETLKEVE